MRDDADRDVQVADHAADHRELLEVLAAEDGEVRLRRVEEHGDDGGDAAEMARSKFTAELGRDAFDVDPGRSTVRVEVGGGRREDQAGARGCAAAAVVLERPRVFGEILIRSELGRVDEDGDHDEGRFFLGPTDQAEVAFMEAAHRRHEADGLARLAGPGGGGTQFGDGVDDLHAANLCGARKGARRSCMQAPTLSFCS